MARSSYFDLSAAQWEVNAHIPHGSGDAEWQIINKETKQIIAIVDPHMEADNPEELADFIVQTMRAFGDFVQ